MEQGIPAGLNAAQARKFGLTVGPAFLVFAGIFLWRDRGTASAVAASLGVLCILLALTAPGLLAPVERVWMRAAHAMSKVTTPIIMGVIYFLVFTPIALAMRAFGRNALVHPQTDGSRWVSRRPEQQQRGGMDHQF